MPSVIEGRIKLSDTSDMKGSAVVQLYRDNDYIREVLSDASGYFAFPNLYPGRYRVIVKMTGYQEMEERVDIIGAGNISR
ncbi:carboxypeptidase regulatory-like domain-containing protein, partial [Citrobacter sp. AAK_AS5]